MGMRERAYWIRQADAIRRQTIAIFAHAVSIGMAGGEDREKAFSALELSETEAESNEKRSRATWDALFFMGGGKSAL